MIREEVVLNNCEKIYLPIVKLQGANIDIRLFDPYDMTNALKVVMQCIPVIDDLKKKGYRTIVVPATKPIPIAWHLAMEFGLNLVVLKKEKKPYYEPFKEFNAKSITSTKENNLFITRDDYDMLNNKKVIFFDDVLSTGATYDASAKFLKEQCNITDLFALFVLKEGDSYKCEGSDMKWLGEIPI